MSRTVISPSLKRRQIHADAPNSQKLSPKRPHRSPKNFSEEDARDTSSDQDENDIEIDGEHTPIKFAGEKCLYPHLPDTDYEYGKKSFKSNAATNRSGSHITYTPKCSRDRISTGKGKDESPKSEKMSSNGCYFLVSFGIICITAVLYYYCWYDEVNPQFSEKSSEVRVTKIVDKLKTEFVDQSDLSFRIIESALAKVDQIVYQPNAPAVLLLMSTKGAEDLTICFAKQLANLTALGEQNYQTIYGIDLKNKDPDRVKKQIDDLIIDTLHHKKQKVVLIENLDYIPSRAVMMLHSYCDDQNAPYKNAVFIMTIDADIDIPYNSDSRQFDEAVDTHLSRVWSDLGKDKLAPLLSRLTVSVVAIYHKAMPVFCK